MPYGKQYCCCAYCGFANYVDTRTVNNHVKLYGVCSTQRNEASSEPDIHSSDLGLPIAETTELEVEGITDDNDDNCDDGEKWITTVIENSSDAESSSATSEEFGELSIDEDSRHSTNVVLPSDAETRPFDEVPCGSQEKVTSEEEFSDSSEGMDYDLCDSTDEEDNIEYTGSLSTSGWCFHYDKEIFSRGIAVEPFNEQLTVLQALVLSLDIFTAHPSISKTAFEKTLKLQKLYNPKIKCWPESFKDAKKLVKPYLIEKKTFQVCSNDCVVYRNSDRYSYAALDRCPCCSTSRYYEGSKVAKKTFIYIPLGPRIARLFGEENLAKLIQAHGVNSGSFDDMWDIHDSPVWNDVYSETGAFLGDKLGLSFAFEMDGVNPFHNIGIQYSMTPIQLTLLNFPRNLRNAFQNIFLMGIIPGCCRSEAKNVQPYVEIIVDELLFLTGCMNTYGAYSNAPVPVKIKLLLFVLDYPGLCKLFLQQGSGSYTACHWCCLRGNYCKELRKMIYLCNRSYLPMDHPLRDDVDNFTEKSKDSTIPPQKRKTAQEEDNRQQYTTASSSKKAAEIAKNTGCKGIYALSLLPGHDRMQSTLPDAMHTIKDVVQTLTKSITGKSGNLDKVLNAENSYGRFLQPTEDPSTGSQPPHAGQKRKANSGVSSSKGRGKRLRQPFPSTAASFVHPSSDRTSVPFQLSKKELKIADDRAEMIRVPCGLGIKPGPFFTNMGSLKSHDWICLITKGILKYCIRGLLGEAQRKTLFRLLDCLAQVCSESQSFPSLDSLEIELNVCIALLERDFPLAVQNITTHLLHHIVDGLKKFGPVYSTWMFVFERFNSWLCKRALNKRYPEATVIETFLIYDFCQFMHATQKFPESVHLYEAADEMQIAEEEKENAEEHKFTHDVINLSGRAVQKLQRAYNRQDSEQQFCSADLSTHATRYYRHSERHPKTNRLIVYTSKRRTKDNAKTVSCVVSLMDCENSPKFGCIDHFIVHRNGGSSHKLAKVDWYSTEAKQDEDSKLFYVPKGSPQHGDYHFLNELTAPLVTAQDGNFIWFLSVKT